MEGEPPSMCVVNASELFPLAAPILEEPDLLQPFTLLAGESVRYLGRTQDGLLALSNYRLHHSLSAGPAGVAPVERSLPLGLVDVVDIRDLFQLVVLSKDARVVKCSFSTNDQCNEWYRRVSEAVAPPNAIEGLFAFPFHAWASQATSEPEDTPLVLARVPEHSALDDFKSEIERLQFDTRGAWRVSLVNTEQRLCPSYPKQLLVPACISDACLEAAANFRSSRRVPAVVWRHRGNGAVVARCSQPEVGWLGWRSSEDEQLMKAVADACAYDRGTWAGSNTDNDSPTPPSSPEGSHEDVSPMQQSKKVLIVDARSYTSAVTNRARGGGCECPEYYCAEIQFMSLGNIHVIRKSFQALRQLCAAPPDCANWLSVLERTHWLQHLSGLLRAAVTVVRAVHKAGQPVLVHCSDGWDRTPQITATALLCLDPYYRTVDGFRLLVEREWLSFGHKFAERCGHQPGGSDPNERCPVFLQWLDVVHQLSRQFPCCFEFSMAYLIKLAQHSHSCLFGTFLCNTDLERNTLTVPERTFSVWPFLQDPAFRNPLYIPGAANKDQVLWPTHNVRDLMLWSEVYLGSLESREDGRGALGDGKVTPEPLDTPTLDTAGLMTKTRSYGDLLNASAYPGLTVRRSSDPNVVVDTVKMSDLNLSDDSIDNETDCEILSRSNYPSQDEEDDHTETNNNPIDLENSSKPSMLLCNGLLENNCKNEDDDDLPLKITNNSCDIPGQDIQELRAMYNEFVASGDNQRTKSEICDLVNGTSVDVKLNGVLNGEERLTDDEDVSLPSSPSPSAGLLALCAPSVETSTDTLVSQNGQTVNVDHWKTQVLYDGCINKKLSSSEYCASSRTSQYSTPGMNGPGGFSRAASALLPVTPMTLQNGDSMDGLGLCVSEEAQRLHQIVYEHKIREDALRRELHYTRMALVRKLCHQCSPKDIPERQDETGSLNVLMECRNTEIWSPSSASASVAERPLSPEPLGTPLASRGSLTDSVCASGASDCSWEALEERTMPGISYGIGPGGVLWVPDHAVSRCTGCDTQFWLGRRKHHCRSCGCIFCADCAEHYAPLPNENLHTPVRLCTPCYHRQSLKSSLLPEPCKRAASVGMTGDMVLTNGRAPHTSTT